MSEKTNDPFQSEAFRRIEGEHLFQAIAFLLEEGIEFAVAAEVEYLTFDPPLPEHLAQSLRPLSLFVLSGYTFESCRVDEHSFTFEAGFGQENFGSVVELPLLAIKQLIVGEYPIAINIADPRPERKNVETERSMEALLSNPENQRLLKKKKE
ncbi:hypothetical protein [Nitratifractor sp.]|uniref:hypothetical protein n=1 Tax=Nitratifractor sp. TaxID=2268144 RepID=UPI0025D4ABFC|nr:hypothetical protein [Nitratifractor sp.]